MKRCLGLVFALTVGCNLLTGSTERAPATDAAVADAAADAMPDPRFVAWSPENSPRCETSDGAILNGHTGLYWEQRPGAAALSIDEARAHCAAIVGNAGFDDWRLPTRAELAAMGNYSSTSGARICTVGGASTVPSNADLCTSSVLASDPSKVYVMSTVDAAIHLKALGEGSTCHPRCVHATKSASRDRFEKTPIGIRDRVTGLLWQSDSLKDAAHPLGEYERGEASGACGALGTASDPFRLPREQELLTLVDETSPEVTIDRAFFPDTEPGGYWVEDLHPDLWAPGTTRAMHWTVDFSNGTTPPKVTTTLLHVRCVRGLPP
jgi:hypothetical protein